MIASISFSRLLVSILEQHKELDYASDGINGGLDYKFKDGSVLNISLRGE